MLKSRGRTDEIPVMGIEGWPQVVKTKEVLFNQNKDYGYDKKDHSNSEMKGVMPYTEKETRKTAVRRRSSPCRILSYAKYLR